MTISNPTVFTRPWTMTSALPMTRQRTPAVLGDFDREDTCHEGNVDLVHLKNVYAKLQVHSKTEAVAKALRERLV